MRRALDPSITQGNHSWVWFTTRLHFRIALGFLCEEFFRAHFGVVLKLSLNFLGFGKFWELAMAAPALDNASIAIEQLYQFRERLNESGREWLHLPCSLNP